MVASQNIQDYYASGNKELATETLLTLQRLEARRKLNKTATRTVIVLVGLPARGKSFVSRKLLHFLNWSGVHCRIFNVGKYRREAYAEQLKSTAATEREHRGACDADFFDASNAKAAELREKVAEYALQDMLRWLDDEEDGSSDDETVGDRVDTSRHSTNSFTSFGSTDIAKLDFKNHQRVAIFDATNSTHKRRQWILEQCTSPELRGLEKQTGVVFVESICDDTELLEENYRYKVSSSPDFDGMPVADALQDLRKRVAKYEAQYETMTDDSMSYIKIFNLSTKLMVNHIYGRMAKEVVPALMAWHIGTRPVFLCRPGQTISGIFTDGEDYVNRQKIDVTDPRFQRMSSTMKRRNLRGDTLGPNGESFRQDLYDFLAEESHTFLRNRASVRDMASTGTSISGLAPGPNSGHLHHAMAHGDDESSTIPEVNSMSSTTSKPFPLRIFTSTMPRAADTVSWDTFHVNQRSNLNPLDKGDFAGMDLDEVKTANPAWFEKLEKDPYNTRFPGGESYRDLMSRLSSVVIDVEQEVIPTLVVSHVSILQCLMAYFRNTRVEKCMSIEVPLHTVIKFTPVRGGGWSESHHHFYDRFGGGDDAPQDNDDSLVQTSTMRHSIESISEFSQLDSSLNSFSSSFPIWGDSMAMMRNSPCAVKK